MNIKDKDLQRLYKAYVMDKIPSSRKNCPSLKRIIDIFSPNSSQKQKTKIIEHITHCAYCAQEFDFNLQIFRRELSLTNQIDHLLAIEKEIISVNKESNQAYSPTKKKQRLFFPRFSWKFAASLITVALIIFSLSILSIKNSLHFFAKKEDRGKSIYLIHLIEPVDKTFSKSSLGFRWSEFKDAKYYTLELFDETLLRIWESPKIYNNQCTLPYEIAKKLTAKKSYFWMVTGFSQEGKQVESNLEEFSLSD
jgi:hypothetical protein